MTDAKTSTVSDGTRVYGYGTQGKPVSVIAGYTVKGSNNRNANWMLTADFDTVAEAVTVLFEHIATEKESVEDLAALKPEMLEVNPQLRLDTPFFDFLVVTMQNGQPVYPQRELERRMREKLSELLGHTF